MALTQLSKDTISKIRDSLPKDQKLVFVSGNFNILHPGHMRLLTFAAECGDSLVVAVNPDASPGTLFPQDVRLHGVRHLSFIQHSFILNDSLTDFLQELKPDVVVKGKEHEEKENPESDVLGQFGGKLIFSSGGTKYGSIDLLKREFESPSPAENRRPKEYIKRHGLQVDSLRAAINKMKKLKVVVIGDSIVDEYIACDLLGASQEDPTLVVTPLLSKKFIGGACIVSSHAKALGATVNFFSTTGSDENAKYLMEQLSNNNVDSHLYADSSRPTTFKQRFRAKEKTLLRVTHLRQHAISKELIHEIFEDMRPKIRDCDLIIFSDFNYGCIPTELRNMISDYANELSKLIVADCQSSSQIGDVSKYENTALLTPTEREARLAMRDFESGLIALSNSLKQKAKAQNIFVTMASEGLLIHAHDENAESGYTTDRLPALNSFAKDTAGAGDCLLVASSLAIASGADIWTSAYLGSLAAACQVERIGNFPLQASELLTRLNTEFL